MKTVLSRRSPLFSQAGFTLFELLVSISIIGILLAVAIVSYTTAQQGGRDARRRTDVKTVQNAMEQYYAQSGGTYTCTASQLTAVLPGGFPKDPKTGAAIQPVCIGTPTTGYFICATMERTDSGNSSTNTNPPNYGATTNRSYFCASNQQ